MFSSTDGSVNLVPQPSPSSSMPSLHSLIDHGNINDLILHHQSPLICPLAASVTYPMMPFKQEIDAPNRAHLFSNPPNNFLPKNRPLKKGKHTKICTAQGLRDRRVRLSIEIARRFFELQDQLGFDQASKTIEWLLTKSRKAIEELSKSDSSSGVNGSFSSISTTCDPKGTHELLVEEKKRSELELVKESRAKARARARERTRVKMSNRRLTDSQLNVLKQPIRALSQHLHDGGKLGSYGESPLTVAIHEDEEPRYHSSLANQVAEGNFFEESVVIKRKLKQSDPLMCYHQNFLMLKDATSSSNNVNNVSSSYNVNNVSSSNYYFLN